MNVWNDNPEIYVTHASSWNLISQGLPLLSLILRLGTIFVLERQLDALGFRFREFLLSSLHNSLIFYFTIPNIDSMS